MASTNHVVVLIHGIRTEATWAERVKADLEKVGDVAVEIVRYGYFDLLRFLFPLGMRRGAISEVAHKIQAVRSYNRNSDVSIIAHSFGTYIIAAILKRDDFFVARRVVFCGSVVPRTFPWSKVAHKITDPKVVNECGTKDIWPVLARAVTFGYGPTGTFGFGDPKVRDRYHPLTHSGYFDSAFVDEFWLPYIATGTIKVDEWELSRPPTPLWMSLLAIVPLRWLIWGIPALLLVRELLKRGWGYF